MAGACGALARWITTSGLYTSIWDKSWESRGEVEDAYHHAYRAHQLHTEVPDVHLTFYNACVNESDYASALAELDEFVKLYPNSDAAKRMLAIRDDLSREVATETRR